MNLDELEKLRQEATPGEWKHEFLGGASTILCDTEPPRNDTRIASYGYRNEQYSITYPFIGDDDRARLDFALMSHQDAALIAAMHAALPSLLLAARALAKLREGEVCDGQVMLPVALFAKVHAACSWNFNALTVVSNEELALLSKLQEQYRAMLSATAPTSRKDRPNE